MLNDLMSSEDSGEDDSIVIHPLPWRAKHVSDMFKKIDQYTLHYKSPQAKRQRKTRKIGSPSCRPKPIEGKCPSWALKQDTV